MRKRILATLGIACCLWLALVLPHCRNRHRTRSRRRHPRGSRHKGRAGAATQWGPQQEPRTVPHLGIELVHARAGRFWMGTRRRGVWAELKPIVHEVVILRPFWTARYEVTQAQYEAVCGHNPSHFRADLLPVEQVTWCEAMEFCALLTERERTAGRVPADYVYRLPTEAEWEYVCRAGTATDWVHDLDGFAWYAANAGMTTHEVGGRKANRWAVHDMLGNVCEWCLDWQGEYARGRISDPRGPGSGSQRIVRGGSWLDDSTYCQPTRRSQGDPEGASSLIGFRIALAPDLGIRGKPNRAELID